MLVVYYLGNSLSLHLLTLIFFSKAILLHYNANAPGSIN